MAKIWSHDFLSKKWAATKVRNSQYHFELLSTFHSNIKNSNKSFHYFSMKAYQIVSSGSRKHPIRSILNMEGSQMRNSQFAVQGVRILPKIIFLEQIQDLFDALSNNMWLFLKIISELGLLFLITVENRVFLITV